MLQQERKSYRDDKASRGLSKRTNLSIFRKSASETKTLKEVRQNIQMQAARKKYNKIGEAILTRQDNNVEKLNNEFIQTTARKRIKRFQDKISDLDTRSNFYQNIKSFKTQRSSRRYIAHR
jgi:hypothetical protein